MKTMSLKKAMNYQISYMSEAVAWFFGIVSAIGLILWLISSIATGTAGVISLPFVGNINIGGYEGNINMDINMAAMLTIMLFIVGIVGIREDLKMFVQHGMGRYTVYFSTLLISLLVGAVMGVVFEIINMLRANVAGFPLSAVAFGSPEGFIAGWFMSFSAIFFVWQFGAAISLVYYRLSGIKSVIFTVVGVAILISGTARTVIDAFTAVIANPDAVATTGFEALLLGQIDTVGWILAAGIICAVINFFLIRHAQIRE